MLAKNNEYLEETAESLFIANADELVRQQCLAREDAQRRERTLERDNKRLKEEKEILQLNLKEKEQQNINAMVDLCKEFGMDFENTAAKIAEKNGISIDEAKGKIEVYWYRNE